MKDPQIRKQEILDASLRLFAKQGFIQTTINDILDAVGIAKGAFYHYFASKDEVLEQIIEHIVEYTSITARRLAANKKMPVVDRIFAILSSQKLRGDQQQIILTLHQSGNELFHLLSQQAVIASLTPILGEVVAEGVASGELATDYPRQAVAMILTSAMMLTDVDSPLADEDQEQTLLALLVGAERLLGAKPGSFISRIENFR